MTQTGLKEHLMDSFGRMFGRHLLAMAIIALSTAAGIITGIVMAVNGNVTSGIIVGVVIVTVGSLVGFLFGLLNLGKFVRDDSPSRPAVRPQNRRRNLR